MVDGLLNNMNIGFVIQARMKSTRLPHKVLMPLPFPDGKPVLSHILDAIGAEFGKNQITVATSVNESNLILEQFCEKLNIKCFRGSEHNVLSRFIRIQECEQYDHIVRLTADNPIVDGQELKRIVLWHIKENNDYSNTVGLPLGMNFEIFKGQAIIDSQKYVQNQFEEEHVTPILKTHDCFKSGSLICDNDLVHHRATIDTVNDFMQMNLIVQIGNSQKLRGLELIRYVGEKHPWVFEGNKFVFQKNGNSDINQELSSAIDLLKKLEYNRTIEILERINRI
ncbi:cytidylyltransferase domain-containing protein [Echinicola shivajiensis]|uniref:cytidylyltransferase domain-containing protein n=1 Tax=Echinicola shivajiensis TaxID=1035916 RepID=UPI001BFC1F69|nr:hypothetical protein [Echinicola shivajiensis]